MFSFLIIIGIALSALGFYLDYWDKDKTQKEFSNDELEYFDEDIEDIKSNEIMIESEDITFKSVLESVIDIEESVEAEQYEADTKDIVHKLESGKYTLEEACEILNMPKGEVLLLKNIYKKSQQ